MDEPQVSAITDKTPKLPGIAQGQRNLLLVAGGLILVLVVVFDSFSAPTVKKTAAPATTALPPDQAKALTAQLKESMNSIAQEKQRVDAMAAQAQLLAAQPPMPVAAPQGYVPPANYQAPAVESKRRSNIAFTFREGAPQAAAKPDTPESQLTDIRGLIDAEKAALRANIAASEKLGVAPVIPQVPTKPSEDPPAGLETYGVTKEKTYKLFEGTLIETVLTNRLNGSFTGPVNVLVTTAVYSHDRQHVLIPQGSRILGEAQRVGTQGQQRLAIVFHRIILPSGDSINLDKFTGLDAAGATGVKDRVDNHWLSIAGTAVALGVVQGVTLSGTGSALTASGFGEYRQGLANATGQAGTQVLSSRLSRLPDIEVREGHRIRVWMNKDVDLPAYDENKIRGDI